MSALLSSLKSVRALTTTVFFGNVKVGAAYSKGFASLKP